MRRDKLTYVQDIRSQCLRDMHRPYLNGVRRTKFRDANEYSLYRVYHNQHSYLWVSERTPPWLLHQNTDPRPQAV